MSEQRVVVTVDGEKAAEFYGEDAPARAIWLSRCVELFGHPRNVAVVDASTGKLVSATATIARKPLPEVDLSALEQPHMRAENYPPEYGFTQPADQEARTFTEAQPVNLPRGGFF
jgi:hypothetical protein